MVCGQEIVGAGGKTVWGDPAAIGKVLEGAAFDVVLDNNGKDLDAVRFASPHSTFIPFLIII